MDFFLHSLISAILGFGNQCYSPDGSSVVKYHNCAQSFSDYGDPWFDLNGVIFKADFL